MSLNISKKYIPIINISCMITICICVNLYMRQSTVLLKNGIFETHLGHFLLCTARACGDITRPGNLELSFNALVGRLNFDFPKIFA